MPFFNERYVNACTLHIYYAYANKMLSFGGIRCNQVQKLNFARQQKYAKKKIHLMKIHNHNG